ncbi:MAG: VTT domain-containing protein [Chitinophagales bacterium]|nr:VTT domain-containing protein [Chitinophagales bacterium]MCZ2394043.1 VTT domain-containing protein [Chitinophagales bacterium]
MIENIKELVFSLDTSLAQVIASMGIWTYFLLFAIIFSETGLLFMTFLPGDTLLFAVGALSAKSDIQLDIYIVNIVLIVAAVSGNMLNYFIGYKFGRVIIESGRMPFFKAENVRSAEIFYNKYGALAVILSRFFPIVRTFVPFVAGIGKMNWMRYMVYNIIGAVLWIGTLTVLGYFFGDLPIVKENLTYIILLLMILPFTPLILSRFLKKSSQ